MHLGEAPVSDVTVANAKILIVTQDKQIYFLFLFLSSPIHLLVWEEVLPAYHDILTPLRGINCTEPLFFCGFFNNALENMAAHMAQDVKVLKLYGQARQVLAYDARTGG